jgi:hypothetical protein
MRSWTSFKVVGWLASSSKRVEDISGMLEIRNFVGFGGPEETKEAISYRRVHRVTSGLKWQLVGEVELDSQMEDLL